MRFKLFGFLLLMFSFQTPIFADAQPVPSNGYAKLSEIPIVFSNILAVVTVLAAMAALVMLIFGGFRYIIAQGDPKAVAAARGTVTWAVVGLVMIIVSWLIILFLSQFLGINLTNFCFSPNPCP